MSKQPAKRTEIWRYARVSIAVLLLLLLAGLSSFSTLVMAADVGSGAQPDAVETHVKAAQKPEAALDEDAAAKSGSHDKALIKIHEKNPDVKTTTFNLATNEMVVTPSDGYVEILRGETVLKASQMTYAQKDQKAVLIGEVSAYQPDLDLLADKLTAWLETEYYVAEGNVHVVQWNLDENNQRLDQKIALDARVVNMDTKANVVHAEGDVYAEEADRRIWADSLDYNDQEELMILVGNVRIETQDGNKLFGNRVVVDMATDEATVYGPVEAELVIEEKTHE